MNNFCLFLLIIVIACTAACGGDSGGGNAGATPPLLAGDPAALAVNALSATGPIAAPAADRSGDLLLTRLSVTLADDATVTQFNVAAEAVGATAIGFAEQRSPFLTLIVPRQTNGAALADLAERLQSQPGILFAAPGRQLAAFTLPGEETGAPLVPAQLQYLLPTHFPAAWNAALSETGQRLSIARNCTRTSEATVIVVDLFQSKPPNSSVHLAPFVGAGTLGAFDEGPDDHGWQVAAILASAFDELVPTGATPLTDCADFVLVDASGLTYVEIIEKLQQAIAEQPFVARIIVNLSIGFGMKFCGPNGDSLCTPANLDATPPAFLKQEMASRITAAMRWALATSEPLDERLLLVQAAGNEAAETPGNGGLGLLFSGIRQADLVSPIALATQLTLLDGLFSPGSYTARGLWDSPPHPSLLLNDANFQHLQDLLAQWVTRLPNRSNLVLVGSATNPAPPAAVTVSAFSNEGAALLAVGENVPTLGRVQEGTSFAAPQVAGLAAYLWAISDLEDRPASETVTLLKATATSNGLLDAYAATLALDALLTINTPGIREALLDVNGDDRFDHQDLLRFKTVYGLDDPNTPTIPTTRDYSRFDLNGDGATGGIITAAFDLDRNAIGPDGAPLINAVDREIEGYPLTFNEAALSDLQILCYYAYSTLYASTDPTDVEAQARTEILGPDRCVGARLNTLFPTEVSGAASLEVTVEVPAGGGQFAPAENLLVTFTPSCGSVSPTSARTNATGVASTTVTPATGCSSVSVAAVASADVGTTALAQKTVSASVPVAPGGLFFSGTLTYLLSQSIDRANKTLSASGNGSFYVRVSLPQASGGVPTVISASGSVSRTAVSSERAYCHDSYGNFITTTLSWVSTSQGTATGGHFYTAEFDAGSGSLELTGSASGSSVTTWIGCIDGLDSTTSYVSANVQGFPRPVYNVDANGNVASIDFNVVVETPSAGQTVTYGGILLPEP